MSDEFIPEFVPLEDYDNPVFRCNKCNAVVQDEQVISGECMGEECPYNDDFPIEDSISELNFHDE